MNLTSDSPTLIAIFVLRVQRINTFYPFLDKLSLTGQISNQLWDDLWCKIATRVISQNPP